MIELNEFQEPVETAKLSDGNLEYFKIMYQDRVDRISETKKFMNELVRWAVTLNLVILAFFVSLNEESRSLVFVVVPVLTLFVSLVLFGSLEYDLGRHRAALGNLRKVAGGIAWQLHSATAREHASGNWRSEFRNAYSVILIVASVGSAAMIVYAKLSALSVAGG